MSRSGSPIVLAVDPDTQCSGIALADANRVYAVGVAITPAGLSGLKAAIEQTFEIGSAAAGIWGMGDFHSVEFRHWDRAVVEAQQVYSQGRSNANNLISLAVVAGGAAAQMRRYVKDVRMPLPAEWKGQQSKGANQRITLEHYDWEFEPDKDPKKPPKVLKVPCPVIGPPIPSAHMKEVVDAMGLALWGARQR